MRKIYFLLLFSGLVAVCTTTFGIVHTYGVVGDAGMRIENIRKVRSSLLASGVRRLILPGDNLYDLNETYSQVWDPWREQGFVFDVVALGNHHKSYAEEMRYFQMPGEYYAKSNGNIRFLVLNSDNENHVDSQMKWLEGQLSHASEEFLFLVYHHPTYNVSTYHEWTEKRGFQSRIRPILWRYRDKITALLLGHDHVASLVSAAGLPLVVSGAAQGVASTKPVDYHDDGIHVKTRWMFEGGPHWVRLDVNTEQKTVWLNFVSAENNKVRCSARIFPGDWLLRPNCLVPTSLLSGSF